jgi:oxalate---CoA ligase
VLLPIVNKPQVGERTIPEYRDRAVLRRRAQIHLMWPKAEVDFVFRYIITLTMLSGIADCSLTERCTVSALLARHPGGSLAIEDERGGSLTYTDLRILTGETQAFLAGLGIGSDDTVAFVLENGARTAALFVALASHCRVAPINPKLKTAEIAFVLRDLNVAGVITTPDLIEAVGAVTECGVGLMWMHSVFPSGYRLEAAAQCAEVTGARTPAGPDDIVLYLHTSGTTARPKLVGLTHRNLCLSSRAVADVLQLTPEDRCLSFMPFFHIHGLVAGVLASLSAGACVWCPPGFQATGFYSWLVSSRATWYTAVPAIHQAILARGPRNIDALAGHRLRVIRSSSSPLFASVRSQLESVFRVPVLNAYGMTEAAHQISSMRLPGGHPAGASVTVGFPSGPEVAILRHDGALLPAGETGEVALRGDQIIRAYLSPAGANESAFPGGWFRTGDEGVLSPAGELTLTGRLKDIINSGGEKVSPVEIDAALMNHPSVAQALAFGVPCPVRGERIYAAVVLRAEVEERELQRYMRERLARFKVPDRIIILDEIPKGPTGKMQRVGMASRLGIG